MNDTIFITGMQRSGTTLLEKLLSAQPALSILSQPFPLVYARIKAAFLATLGASDLYPLGHLFLETRYAPEEFSSFLESPFSGAGIDLFEVFDRMPGYSGQYTRFDRSEVESAIGAIAPHATVLDVLASLYRSLACRGGATLCGGKETTCEEFLPAMVDAGWRCALIVRDPRDVVTSLNHGTGPEFGGRIKPTLFNVRQWRKSVAFALELEGRPGFAWARYEDLVRDPSSTLSSIGEALGAGPIDASLPMLTGVGEPWAGNSSHHAHRGVGAGSLGSHRTLLPAEVRAFVEAACLPEMIRLGYDTEVEPATAAGVLRSFREPYETRSDLEQDAAGPPNLETEVLRLNALLNGAADAVLPFFPFERVGRLLRVGA